MQELVTDRPLAREGGGYEVSSHFVPLAAYAMGEKASLGLKAGEIASLNRGLFPVQPALLI